MSNNCNLCNQKFTWKKPYDGTKLNLDGTAHSCKKKETFTDNAITSVTILAEIEAFRQKFGPIESDARFESLAKIYISRMMSRR